MLLTEISDVRFGTRISVQLKEGVCLKEGVRLIGGPLNRGFTVLWNDIQQF